MAKYQKNSNEVEAIGRQYSEVLAHILNNSPPLGRVCGLMAQTKGTLRFFWQKDKWTETVVCSWALGRVRATNVVLHGPGSSLEFWFHFELRDVSVCPFSWAPCPPKRWLIPFLVIQKSIKIFLTGVQTCQPSALLRMSENNRSKARSLQSASGPSR